MVLGSGVVRALFADVRNAHLDQGVWLQPRGDVYGEPHDAAFGLRERRGLLASLAASTSSSSLRLRRPSSLIPTCVFQSGISVFMRTSVGGVVERRNVRRSMGKSLE